jgi:hypothetical protein
MTDGFEEEFSTVERVLNSGAGTAGVDAFALSLIKSERQVRKLFTYLIYQSPAFGQKDKRQLRKSLAANTQVYFEGLVKGLNLLSPVSVQHLVGAEYARLWPRFTEFSDQRNKIFHGQITADGLSKSELLTNVSDIKTWCENLGAGASRELGCSGFVRNSFKKSSIPDLQKRLRVQIKSVGEYAAFIHEHIERKKNKK